MRVLMTALAAGLLATTAAFGQAAFDGHVRVGVLNDQSSLYADATGQGSVIAARMAIEDYMKANPNSKLKVELIFADHQNKPDIGSNIARQWIEREGVDMILDVPNSAVALAVLRRFPSAPAVPLGDDKAPFRRFVIQSSLGSVLSPMRGLLGTLLLGAVTTVRQVSYFRIAPVPESADDGVNYKQHVVSSGPYKFSSYTAGTGFTLVRNDQWDPATDTEEDNRAILVGRKVSGGL